MSTTRTPIYRGFSTAGNDGLQTQLTDIDLVVQDLKNHFNTRLDERVARPRFGFIGWELLFDLSDSRTEELFRSNVEQIIAMDPRVRKKDLRVTVNHDAHRIDVDVTVNVIEFDMDAFFQVSFSELQ